MLAKLDLQTVYKKTTDDISNGFYQPCMRESVQYDRLSGYFSSAIYLLVWNALKEFLDNSGNIRIVCSPELTNEDRLSILEGEKSKSDSKLSDSLLKSLNLMLSDEESVNPSKLLACLISQGILEMKLAIPYSENALYHDKVGIFRDSEGNRVAFRGAMNETYKGLADDGNIESVEVFTSWDGKRDLERVESAQEAFDEIWYGLTNNVLVYDLPESVRYHLLEISKSETIPDLIYKITEKKENEIETFKTDSRELRKHQAAALNDWREHNRRGLLEHATGSGKTFTALTAIRESLDLGTEVPLILVPSTDLINQWVRELDELSNYILICDGQHHGWADSLHHFSQKKNTKKRVIISTLQTASTEKFSDNLQNGEHIFLVVDEVHRCGSSEFRNILSTINAGARLGLSATPKRYGDPDGTAAIYEYFERTLVPTYTLQDAIQDKVLTAYEYNPIPVTLTVEETEEWAELSKKIKRKYARIKGALKGKEGDVWANDSLKSLLIQRSRIRKRAEGKLLLAREELHKYEYGQKWIVYCDSLEQIDQLYDLLKSDEFFKNILILKYHSKMSKDERKNNMGVFADNSAIFLSVKCLDEGIDIPSVSHALIISSSQNPREFIQRRGRILRKYPGKRKAYLADMIVVPPIDDADEELVLSITKSELVRALQFSETAINSAICHAKLNKIAVDNNVNIDNLTEEGGYDEEEFT